MALSSTRDLPTVTTSGVFWACSSAPLSPPGRPASAHSAPAAALRRCNIPLRDTLLDLRCRIEFGFAFVIAVDHFHNEALPHRRRRSHFHWRRRWQGRKFHWRLDVYFLRFGTLVRPVHGE